MNGSPDVFYVRFWPLSSAQVPFYGREKLGIAFDADVLTELARRLQLSYLPEESLNAEMCFLHSPELRPEFKLSFNLGDFTDFLNGVLSKLTDTDGSEELRSGTLPVPYPEDSDEFWKFVGSGAVNR